MVRYLRLFALVGLISALPAQAARYDGKLTLTVIDQDAGDLVPARMYLKDSRGRAVRIRAEGVVSHGKYFAFPGEVTLELRKGRYEFLIEAGPEYHTRPGHFTIEKHSEDQKEVELKRHVTMQKEGWWAGDVDVRHRQRDLPLMMQAGGVHFAPHFYAENKRGKCLRLKEVSSRVFPALVSIDNRRGGGLLFLEEKSHANSLKVCEVKEDDSSLPILDTAKSVDAHAVALTPFAWDLPLWVAKGKLDAVQIIHRHALSDGVVDNEAGGRKRDKSFFPGKMGNGRWSEVIYHHLLNCGLRIPPVAGSGSGATGSPVGTNRTYVFCREYSPSNWLAGLQAGQVIVTNGPLLRTQVAGQPPGHVFSLTPRSVRDFQIGLSLSFYEKAPVQYLEIIKNGRVEHEVRLDELARKRGRLPILSFRESGWFLVRAITSNTENYQYASTGPYYVDAGEGPRVSRRSVQFFLEWLDEAEEKFSENPTLLEDIAHARPFWEGLERQANAD